MGLVNATVIGDDALLYIRRWATLLPAGKPGFVVIDGPDEAPNPYAFSVVQMVQNTESGKIEERPLPRPDFPLYVLRVGAYTSAEEAENRRTDCMAGLQLIDGSTYPLSGGEAFFGGLFLQRKATLEATRYVKECNAELAATVDEYTGEPEA